jgi:hypothetical protein
MARWASAARFSPGGLDHGSRDSSPQGAATKTTTAGNSTARGGRALRFHVHDRAITPLNAYRE